ncbi:MAG: PAS domain-containing protein [Spirochaetia bacterium]|nr:PAS domain-containing protein [Spirochaetia bacterium]
MSAQPNVPDNVYRTLFLDSQAGMYISTTDGRFLDVNKSLCQMLGLTREALMDRAVESTYELPAERRRFTYEIESNGAVRNFDIRLKTSSNQTLLCTLDAVIWRDDQGAIGGYVGIIRGRSIGGGSPMFPFDDERFILAMRGSNDGLWEWNIRRKRAHFSQRWKALLGYANSEIGDSMDEWFNRVHPEDLPKFKHSLARYLKREAPVFSCYHRMKHRDGTYGWMMGRGVAEFSDSGTVVRIAGSLTDVSGHLSTIEQLKTQESALSKKNERLERDRELLSRYFPEELVERITEKDAAPLKSVTSRAAVIYLKLKDSIPILNALKAQRFAELLNDFSTDVLDLVYSHRGSVNRVLGDSILITFGCPVSSGTDVDDALECALDIRRYMRVFNDVRPEGLTQNLRVGMGLAYGGVFAGSIGSVRRMEYTILGPAVSTAQILMERTLASEYDILIGPDMAGTPAGTQAARPTELKNIYTVIDPRDESPGALAPSASRAAIA